ncbi:hypothetical protein HN51_016606, partial [Arachis hypogaea]
YNHSDGQNHRDATPFSGQIQRPQKDQPQLAMPFPPPVMLDGGRPSRKRILGAAERR